MVYLERFGNEWYVRILELKNKNYVPKLIFSLFSCKPNLHLLSVVRKYEWQCLKTSSVKQYVKYMELYENDYKMHFELQIYFVVYRLVS